MNRRRLVLTRDNDACAWMGLQFLGDCKGAGRPRALTVAGDAVCELAYRSGCHSNAMIRHAAGYRWRALRDIQPRWSRIRAFGCHAPPGAVIASVAQTSRHRRTKEVGVQGKDHIGPIETVSCIQWPTERHDRASSSRVAPARLVLMPFRGRVRGEKLLDLRRERRRCYGARQNTDACALLGRCRVPRAADCSDECAPPGDVAIVW